MTGWPHSIWFGTTYATASGRTVLLESPAWIFSCPRCEYRMTAHDEEGARTVRRMHTRTVHPSAVLIVDALDRDRLPRHLAAKR